MVARLVRDHGGVEPGHAAVRRLRGRVRVLEAVLTLVFATYALVLAPSLLVFGQLSDRLGRRRVMAAGFATATVGLMMFAAARACRGCSRPARCRAWPSG